MQRVRTHLRKVKGNQKVINQYYRKYHQKTNMSYSELSDWAKQGCSRKASLNRVPIQRNLKLLKKPMNKWNMKDVKEAKKTISFNSRMQKVKPGKPICDELSKRDISLKNWAYDPNK